MPDTTDSADTSYIYPPNGTYASEVTSGDVNIYDTLNIVYESSRSKLNLTLFCLSEAQQTTTSTGM